MNPLLASRKVLISHTATTSHCSSQSLVLYCAVTQLQVVTLGFCVRTQSVLDSVSEKTCQLATSLLAQVGQQNSVV